MKNSTRDSANKNLPKADFAAHRRVLKEAVMEDYKMKYEEAPAKKSWFRSGAFKLSGSFAVLAVVGVFAFATVANPLTAQRVLAEAQTAIESAEENGRYRYSKTQFTDTFNGQTNTYTMELWEDTETGEHRMNTIDGDNKLVDSIVFKDDKIYAKNLSFNVALGDDTATLTSSIADSDESIEAFEIPEDELLTLNNGEAIELNGDLDSSLGVVIGDKPLTEEELDALIEIGDIEDFSINEELSPEEVEELFGDDVAIATEASSVVAFGPMTQDLVRNSNTNDRKELFNELLGEEGASLVEQKDWNGRQVVGIAHNETEGFNSTIYFDAETYRYVGSEFGGDDGFMLTEVVLEESYSDEPIDLSTEGLEEIGVETMSFDLGEVIEE